MNRVFDMDQLPVSFGASLESASNGTPDRRPLNEAVRNLVDLIWQAGGFRFRHRGSSTKNGAHTIKYYCCQNEQVWKGSKRNGKRDVEQMDRFKCGGKMTIRPSIEARTLNLTIAHSHHKAYAKIQLDGEIQAYIDERITNSTPSRIYHDVKNSGLSGCERVAQYQVYYRWQQGNASNWRYHPEQFESAKLFLGERSAAAHCDSKVFTSGNLRGLALFARKPMSCLRSRAKELAMDATYGTNNAGMNLFAVLAEMDGTGIPLAYCFIGKIPSVDGAMQGADPGATTGILRQFLSHIRQAGFSPTFFGTDKDQSEISAVKQVWGEGVTLQLCYWHAKRALRTKLKDSAVSKTQAHYSPADALKLVPGLEICWGSSPTRRPNGDHRYGRCQCPSATVLFEEKGRIEKLSTAEKEIVVQMFSRHFNSHSLIPDRNNTFRSPEVIHRECTAEMYSWCRTRNYFRLWAYLFGHWYCPDQWELWARSTNAAEIPILKTTMIVESHRRRLKHDYLHQFNRPRIDLVAWVLVSRVIPDAAVRMEALEVGDQRIAKSGWRKPFKSQWKALQERTTSPDSMRHYFTDPLKWVCACEAFLDSRFFICKHLVHCVEPFSSPVEFFSKVQRRRTIPFFRHTQLMVLPEYRMGDSIEEAASQDPEPTPRSITDDSGTESEDSEDLESEEEATSDDGTDHEVQDRSGDEVDNMQDLQDFLGTLQSAMDIAREQGQKGNRPFVEKFISSLSSAKTLVAEVDRKRNRRSMNPTWGKYHHPASMYYS